MLMPANPPHPFFNWPSRTGAKGYRMLLACLIALIYQGASQAQAPSWPAFTFTNDSSVAEWTAPHDSVISATSNGLLFTITGPDPFLHGPARDYPANQPGWLEVTLRSSEPGNGQVFWYRDGARESDSIRFAVGTTNWLTAKLPVPPLGPGYHLRFDPPGEQGTCVVRSIVSSPRYLFAEPVWPQLARVEPSAHPMAELSIGSLTWQQSGSSWGQFILLDSGQPIAQGNPRPQWAWVDHGQIHWGELTNRVELLPTSVSNRVVLQTTATTDQGAVFRIEQSVVISPNLPRSKNFFVVITKWEALTNLDVLFASLLLIHPRPDVFGSEPHQALFAGVEYLESESSSSEKSLRGPQALRRVPEASKITIPLMAVASTNQWVSLDWTVDERVSALFDVPDRIWRSGGPVLGLIAPGSAAPQRPDGALLPYEPLHLAKGDSIQAQATVVVEAGSTVVPAIERWVRWHWVSTGNQSLGRDETIAFLESAAHGWLDSKLRDGNRYRHAVGPNFGAQPAADAALWMDWLANKVHEPGLADRLRTASAGALAEVPPTQWHSARIGHIRQPLLPLAYGHVKENLLAMEDEAHALVRQLGTNGTLLYVPRPGHVDLSETHGSREANGLASLPIRSILQTALITGNQSLRDDGLRLLQTLDHWTNSVPRGAQSWEVPLHAPDILASAQLIDVYRLAFDLTGDKSFLDQAEYWALTGIPFVYLPQNAIPGRVGRFATTPVFGATEYIAPNWIGLPVQWCGLVYGQALRDLFVSESTTTKPRFDWWTSVARGITWSGVQQSHPREDPARVGLLPDSFDLKAQSRNPVPINPATLLPGVSDFLGNIPLFSSTLLFQDFELRVHVPGRIYDVYPYGGKSPPGKPLTYGFTIAAWPDHPWRVLITGLNAEPKIRINGQPHPLGPDDEWVADHGWLILKQTEKTVQVELSW